LTDPAKCLYRLKLKKKVVDSDGNETEQVGYITFAHNIDQNTVFIKAKKMAYWYDSVEVMEAPLVFDAVIASYVRRPPVG